MRPISKTARRSLKTDRLEARVTAEQKQLVASAQEAAAETIKDFEILTLHDKARDVFVDVVLHPPEPNETARKAARRYIGKIGRGEISENVRRFNS